MVVRWVLAGLLISGSLWIVLTNLSTFIQHKFYKRAGVQLPLMGGLLGAGALLLAPLPEVGPFWWIPLLVDPGCAYLILKALVRALRPH